MDYGDHGPRLLIEGLIPNGIVALMFDPPLLGIVVSFIPTLLWTGYEANDNSPKLF